MRKLSLLMIFAAFLASSTWPQADNAKLRIRTVLIDKDLNQKPVPKFSFVLVPFEGPAGQSVTGRTGFDGAAEVQVPPGKYRLSTPDPVEFQGKTYSWELDIQISTPESVIDLSNDNAKVAQATPARKVDELTALFQKYQNAVVTVWSEVGTGTGFCVDKAGLFITNQHVIGPSIINSVQFDAKRRVTAIVLAIDPQKDVAVLWANPSAFPEMIVAPVAKSEVAKEAVVEGERVFTIGSPLTQRKILTSGIVSKIEARAIISDININHGNSGGPLFNSIGEVVGITTFRESSGPGVAGIVKIEQAFPTLEQAHRKMRDAALPSARYLPVEPTRAYPLDTLKETISAEKFNRHPYLFSESGFDVAMVTPVLKYRMEEEVQLAAAKEKSKRTKKHEEAIQNTFEPLRDLRGWAEYAGEYRSVLLIRAAPQLRETFGSAFSRGLLASRGLYGPAHLKYKTDFYRMRLLCGGKEVEPINPGKVANVINAHNVFVNVTDATYEGFYSYPPDAIHPSCGDVVLELYSEKEPEKPVRKVLDKKSVDRIWSDFQPYFAPEGLHEPVAVTEGKKEPEVPKQSSEKAAPGVSARLSKQGSEMASPMVSPDLSKHDSKAAVAVVSPDLPKHDSASVVSREPSKRSSETAIPVTLPDRSKQRPEAAAPAVNEGSTAGGAPISTRPAETTSTIIVTSEPTGAAIYVDDSSVGIAPVTLKLKPGQHVIRAFKNGYQNWFRAVTVETGQNLSLTVTMQKAN